MVKRKPSCWSRRRLESVWTACLAFALLAVFCPGQTLRAADLVGSPSSNSVTSSLAYQETDYSVVNWSVSLTPQTAPFTNEPAATGKIVRGILNFGGDPAKSMAFVWQRDAGKLFLDLNRNRDFADDPAGVFSARGARRANYQTFTNVHLPLATAAGNCPALADLIFWDYGSRPGCNLALRSFWQGRVTLQGRDWQVGLIQNPSHSAGSLENGQLLLRPWEKRNQPFNAYDGSLATVPFSRKLFVDDHAYQLDLVANSENGAVRPALQFTEQPVALGELKITGKFIRRLVLPGGPYLVLLDQPAGVVKIPTGNYQQPNVRLEQNGVEAYCNSRPQPSGKQFSVDTKTPAVLDVGGPLINSVSASRHGEDLRLDYRLVGAGGETYQLANENRSHPPQFAIFKGDKKIASGNFEFG